MIDKQKMLELILNEKWLDLCKLCREWYQQTCPKWTRLEIEKHISSWVCWLVSISIKLEFKNEEEKQRYFIEHINTYWDGNCYAYKKWLKETEEYPNAEKYVTQTEIWAKRIKKERKEC